MNCHFQYESVIYSLPFSRQLNNCATKVISFHLKYFSFKWKCLVLFRLNFGRLFGLFWTRNATEMLNQRKFFWIDCMPFKTCSTGTNISIINKVNPPWSNFDEYFSIFPCFAQYVKKLLRFARFLHRFLGINLNILLKYSNVYFSSVVNWNSLTTVSKTEKILWFFSIWKLTKYLLNYIFHENFSHTHKMGNLWCERSKVQKWTDKTKTISCSIIHFGGGCRQRELYSVRASKSGKCYRLQIDLECIASRSHDVAWWLFATCAICVGTNASLAYYDADRLLIKGIGRSSIVHPLFCIVHVSTWLNK